MAFAVLYIYVPQGARLNYQTWARGGLPEVSGRANAGVIATSSSDLRWYCQPTMSSAWALLQTLNWTIFVQKLSSTVPSFTGVLTVNYSPLISLDGWSGGDVID